MYYYALIIVLFGSLLPLHVYSDVHSQPKIRGGTGCAWAQQLMFKKQFTPRIFNALLPRNMIFIRRNIKLL